MPAEMLVRIDIGPRVRGGAIIAVKPEGWQWGTEELSNRFARVRVTDADPADLEHYLGDYRVGPDHTRELSDKKLYYIESTQVDNIASLPDRLFITDKATVDAVMRNIIDNG